MTIDLEPDMRSVTLDDKYTLEVGRAYMTGIHAVVRVLLDQARADERAGLNTAGFVSGYPGSPVGSLDREIANRSVLLRDHDVVGVAGLNEDLAATAVFGTQMSPHVAGMRVDGVFGLWYGKAPGLDRSADAIRHGMFRGTSPLGGVVAVVGDDPQPSSSTVPSDSNRLLADLFMPILAPADVQDVLDLGRHAYAMSRASGLGVGFKLVTAVADASQTVELDPERVQPVVPDAVFDGVRFVPQPTRNETGARLLPREQEINEKRLAVAIEYARANQLNRITGQGSAARLGIVASGHTYLEVLEALRRMGVDPDRPDDAGIRLCRLGMVWPLDDVTVREFASGLDEVLVVEDKRSFTESAIRDCLYGIGDPPAVTGKFDATGQRLLPAHGSLDAHEIEQAIRRRLEAVTHQTWTEEPPPERLGVLTLTVQPATPDAAEPETVPRTPHFCSGCPHNRGLEVPEGSMVGAGIGCHIMQTFMDKEEYGHVTGFTQMGGEGAQWVGLAPFTDAEHIFQNVGDGTFSHSASQSIRFAVAAGVNITFKILHNAAVAMTGGQDVTGGFSVPEMTKLLEAERVQKIVIVSEDPRQYRRADLAGITDVRHRDDIIEVERELASTPGVTVLIHDQHCAAEARRLRKRGALPHPSKSVMINERICEGCGDCGEKSNCLSVEPTDTEFGRKTRINQSTCNFDYSCLRGDCPSFMTITTSPRKQNRRDRIPPPTVEIPDPIPQVPAEDFAVHMSGIGGTGVVTINQVLATAALVANRHVRAMDKLGGSQKAGPVTSNLRISTKPTPRSSSVSSGQADALLVFDLLVATDPKNLAKADASRTIAVASLAKVPTGAMVGDVTRSFPSLSGLVSLLERHTRAGSNRYLDAIEISEQAFGDHIGANMVLVGAAYQMGLLPLPESSILEAIRLNGVAVDLNHAAFRWGRLAIAEPDLVSELATAPAARAASTQPPASVRARVKDALAGAPDHVASAVTLRYHDLVGYQNRRYADRFLATVARTLKVESDRVPGNVALTEAVSSGLHRTMAYKDEYEVARLALDPVEADRVSAEFGPDAEVRWMLHPPVLRAMGMKRKVALGSWFRPAFAALARLRRVRGTALDMFGRTDLRRFERDLIDHYMALVEALLDAVGPDNHAEVVAAAKLIDDVRGFEEVKLRNARTYADNLREMGRRLGLPDELTRVQVPD